MVGSRVGADEQRFADLSVGPAGGDEAQHLDLAPGQTVGEVAPSHWPSAARRHTAAFGQSVHTDSRCSGVRRRQQIGALAQRHRPVVLHAIVKPTLTSSPT